VLGSVDHAPVHRAAHGPAARLTVLPRRPISGVKGPGAQPTTDCVPGPTPRGRDSMMIRKPDMPDWLIALLVALGSVVYY